MEKIKQNLIKKLISSETFRSSENFKNALKKKFHLARASLVKPIIFIGVLLIVMRVVSAGDIIAKAGDLKIGGNMTIYGPELWLNRDGPASNITGVIYFDDLGLRWIKTNVAEPYFNFSHGIRINPGINGGDMEIENGSVCIGDGGCTAPTADGELTVANAINAKKIKQTDEGGIKFEDNSGVGGTVLDNTLSANWNTTADWNIGLASAAKYFRVCSSGSMGELDAGCSNSKLFEVTGTQAKVGDNSSVNLIVSGGKVGIGVFNSPDNKLHIMESDAGASSNAYADLTIEDIAPGLQFLSPNTQIQYIYFGDPENSAAGQIQYLHPTNSFKFLTNATDRLVVSSSGVQVVGVGLVVDDDTVPPSTTAGDVEIADGYLCVTDSDGADCPASGADGSIYAENISISKIDLAENYIVDNPNIESGEVLCFKSGSENLDYCSEAYDTKVAGIVSTNPGSLHGGSIGYYSANCLEDPHPDCAWHRDEYNRLVSLGENPQIPYRLVKNESIEVRPIALKGKIPAKVICNVDIEIGDQLVTSDVPGKLQGIDWAQVNQWYQTNPFEVVKRFTGVTVAKATESCSAGTEVVMEVWV